MVNKLFDYYVRDMKNWMESIEHDLSELYEDADKINKLISRSNIKQDYKDSAQFVLTTICNIYEEFSSKLDDLKQLDIICLTEADKLKSQLNIVNNENTELKVRLNNMNKDTNELKKEIIALVKKIESLDNTGKGLSTDIKTLLGLIDNNVEALATSIRMKSEDNRGTQHHRYKGDVNNEVLKAEYIANGYKITKAMLEKYKGIMTYQGIRERLIEENVWKGRK